MNEFEKLKQIVSDSEEDADKFYGKDNHAAGTRLRKQMMEIKNQVDAVRKEVQKIKES